MFLGLDDPEVWRMLCNGKSRGRYNRTHRELCHDCLLSRRVIIAFSSVTMTQFASTRECCVRGVACSASCAVKNRGRILTFVFRMLSSLQCCPDRHEWISDPSRSVSLPRHRTFHPNSKLAKWLFTLRRKYLQIFSWNIKFISVNTIKCELL